MRDRVLQVVLVLVGLFYFGWIYFLFVALWRSAWIHGYHESLPMFLSLNVVLGVFLLLSVKEPAKHRTLIAYAGWSSLVHACTMAIQTTEAWKLGIHRDPSDVALIGIIGLVLLALLPNRKTAATDSVIAPESSPSAC